MWLKSIRVSKINPQYTSGEYPQTDKQILLYYYYSEYSALQVQMPRKASTISYDRPATTK